MSIFDTHESRKASELEYERGKLDACLRTLAWMIECDTCVMKCNTDDEPNPDCITKLIGYAKNNPTEEAAK